MPSALATAHNWSFAVYVIAVFAICIFMVGAAYFLGGRSIGPAKTEAFESGVVPQGSAELRLSAKFYLITMMFVIFDVEALFLYAWAVSIRETGWTGFIEAFIFIAILLVGLVYIVRIGVLDWAPEGRRQRRLKEAATPTTSDAH